MTRRTEGREYRKKVYNTRLEYNRYVRGLILTAIMLNCRPKYLTRRRMRIDRELLTRYQHMKEHCRQGIKYDIPETELECCVCYNNILKDAENVCKNGHHTCVVCYNAINQEIGYGQHVPCPLCRTTWFTHPDDIGIDIDDVDLI